MSGLIVSAPAFRGKRSGSSIRAGSRLLSPVRTQWVSQLAAPPGDEKRYQQQEQEDDRCKQETVVENGIKHRVPFYAHGYRRQYFDSIPCPWVLAAMRLGRPSMAS